METRSLSVGRAARVPGTAYGVLTKTIQRLGRPRHAAPCHFPQNFSATEAERVQAL